MSFISTGNLNAAAFTSAYTDFFDYFKREVIVYKTPQKTVADVNLSFLYGYGTDSNGDNYSFTPVSGIFSGLAIYKSNINDQDLTEADIRMPDNNLRLKVTEEARNYINNGVNEAIEIALNNDDVVVDVNLLLIQKVGRDYTIDGVSISNP